MHVVSELLKECLELFTVCCRSNCYIARTPTAAIYLLCPNWPFTVIHTPPSCLLRGQPRSTPHRQPRPTRAGVAPTGGRSCSATRWASLTLRKCSFSSSDSLPRPSDYGSVSGPFRRGRVGRDGGATQKGPRDDRRL